MFLLILPNIIIYKVSIVDTTSILLNYFSYQTLCYKRIKNVMRMAYKRRRTRSFFPSTGSNFDLEVNLSELLKRVFHLDSSRDSQNRDEIVLGDERSFKFLKSALINSAVHKSDKDLRSVIL